MTKQSNSSGNKNEFAEQPNGCQTTDLYEVGYGKPPKSTQFKKGRSGNPSGRRPRKKDSQSESHDVRESFRKVFGVRVKANVGGENRYLDGMETAFWVLRAKVSKGELQAVRVFIDFCKHFKIADPNKPNAQLEGLFEALMAGPVKDTPEYKRLS
jgi:Family of unknown function (DUF5681)